MDNMIISKSLWLGDEVGQLYWGYSLPLPATDFEFCTIGNHRLAITQQNFYLTKQHGVASEPLRCPRISDKHCFDIYGELLTGVYRHFCVASEDHLIEFKNQSVRRMERISAEEIAAWMVEMIIIDETMPPVIDALRHATFQPHRLMAAGRA